MKNYIRWKQHFATFIALAVLSSCGLPQAGPNKNQIYKGSVQKEGNAFVIDVDDYVTRAIAYRPGSSFSNTFRNASVVGSDTIHAGDQLSLTIWENVDDGLLAREGVNATSLEQMQVDDAGFIFVPYAGRIKAAGNSPEAIRRIITKKLSEQTPDPQVQVHRVAGDGSTVSIAGTLGTQGIVEITRPTRTLSKMLARVGGSFTAPELVKITLKRGRHIDSISLQDLYDNPANDVALRSGDQILLERVDPSYTILGAAGGQSKVAFEKATLTAIEALARVGGLNAMLADPSGIFVFREEPAAIANRVMGRNDLSGPQRMIYLLNLTEPNGIFHARDFDIRDQDTIYVTEAPITQWNKTIAVITGSANNITGLANVASGSTGN